MGRDQLCGVCILRPGTAKCLEEAAGGDMEWYDGGPGEETDTQWIGWSLELVSQVGHVYSGASGSRESCASCASVVSRYIGMFALSGESGNLDIVGK